MSETTKGILGAVLVSIALLMLVFSIPWLMFAFGKNLRSAQEWYCGVENTEVVEGQCVPRNESNN